MAMLALVTGASRGIGLAVAKALAADGYDLVLTCSRTKERLEEAAQDIRLQYGVKVITSVCDAADPDAVETLFRDVIGPLACRFTLLVNNAGISYFGLLQDMSVEEWNRVISADLSSVFYSSRKAIPYFLSNEKGCIINISSVWGNVGASVEAAYSAAKGGVNSLTRALGKELAPSGIPVNAIACGCVDTAMNGHLSAEEQRELSDSIPAGRFADTEEIAQAVIALVHSPAYLTGQIITIDGGWI